ncbi:MAG TPA: AMP-binding protein [Thermoanaerobaculia bacterium]|nr:AMP-binding protein [Thermoanaerobaculia bacterium]
MTVGALRRSPGTAHDRPLDLRRVLADAGRRAPDRGITLVDNRGRDKDRRTYAELHRAAQLMAGRYRELGLEPGDRVLLCLPTSWEWLDCWFGAVLLGAVPCAIATPGALGSPTAQLEKTLRVCERIGARFLVGAESVQRDTRRILEAGFAEQTLHAPLCTDLLAIEQLVATAPASPVPESDVDEASTAYLQLTSGSTGQPRAVELSHRAAIHNALACAERIGQPHGAAAPSVIVSWLPLYHDMGLVGCLLQALASGVDLHLMSPRTFLGRPRLWLERISGLEGVMSPAPNFAYQLCAERVGAAGVEGLDLRGFRDAITGSELVRPETVDAFSSSFEAAGFTREQLRPAYGLAEATLAVTLNAELKAPRLCQVPAGGPRELRAVVGNGVPVRDTRVEIRDPAGGVLPSHAIGEVWVRGPGVMNGYLGDAEATAETLRDGWLDTGDLGFRDHEGELYLTGRKKEILILQGHNLMPHELEWVAEGVAGSGGAERSGAFSVPSVRGERAVLVIETTEQDPERLRELGHEVASAVGRLLGVPLADLVLVRRGTLPRTSSGKIQRTALRDSYLRGEVTRERLVETAGAPLPAMPPEQSSKSEAT